MIVRSIYEKKACDKTLIEDSELNCERVNFMKDIGLSITAALDGKLIYGNIRTAGSGTELLIEIYDFKDLPLAVEAIEYATKLKWEHKISFINIVGNKDDIKEGNAHAFIFYGEKSHVDRLQFIDAGPYRFHILSKIEILVVCPIYKLPKSIYDKEMCEIKEVKSELRRLSIVYKKKA